MLGIRVAPWLRPAAVSKHRPPPSLGAKGGPGLPGCGHCASDRGRRLCIFKLRAQAEAASSSVNVQSPCCNPGKAP